MEKQKGFALVAVFILSVFTSVLVVYSMQDVVLQRHLTEGYRKSLSDRHTAEHGIYDTYQKLKEAFARNKEQSLEQLIASVLDGQLFVTGKSFDGAFFESTLSRSEDGLLVVKSRAFDGENIEPNKKLTAYFRVNCRYVARSDALCTDSSELVEFARFGPY